MKIALLFLGVFVAMAVAKVKVSAPAQKILLATQSTVRATSRAQAMKDGFKSYFGANFPSALEENAQLLQTRWEASLEIALTSNTDITAAYSDVLRRIVNFRLLDPKLQVSAQGSWMEAVGQLFQLPGSLNDPALNPDSKAAPRDAFIDFNSDRSGNPFGRAAALLSDYVPPVKGVSPRKFKAGVDRKKHLEAAIQDLFETIEATENIRIKFHLLSRATECGEKHYEGARKANPTATSDLDDKFYETGCMRWIIQQAYLGFSDSKSPANAYWTLLEKAGFSKSHLVTQHRNLYNAQGGLVNGDDNLSQKGWLTPVWLDFAPSAGNTKKDAENKATANQFEAIDKVTVGNVCRKARPNGGNVDPTKPGAEKFKGEARVFRYKPAAIDKSKLTKPLLNQAGLSKMDPHEEAFLKGFNPNFNDATNSFWGYGGAVWVLNGALADGANADGQRFMQARKEQLLTTAAGPSGTTDEMLQMFDYCGLTGNPVTSDPLKEITAYKASQRTPSWHLANGVLGAFGNMGVYYHHSYLEVLEGAGCDYNGKNSVDRAFDYDIKNPYDWMLSLQRPAKVSLCSMAYDKTKKDAPKFTIGESQLGGSGIKFEAIQTAYKLLSDPKSSQHQALLATDFPNYDSKDTRFYPGKGPHQWARNNNVQALTEKDANLVCSNKDVPKTGVWHFLFCGAQKESMSLLSAAVSKKMTFDQLDAAFSALI